MWNKYDKTVCLVVLILLLYSGCSAESSLDEDRYESENGVCGNIDIYGTIDDFKQLKNCRVIEGYLHIINVYASESVMQYISFPLLTEITDYFALIEVRGLKTLSKLFPNLSVIRGNKLLVAGYSFIIINNPNLVEIGLQELKHIGRGAVRIGNNPELCYANTIDWSVIAPYTSHAYHYVQNNQNFIACEPCQVNCPRAHSYEYTYYQDQRNLCWNTKICQSLCPAECESHGCDQNGECCDESCIGGCSEINSNERCNACKNVKLNGKCIDDCADSYYKLNNRRCVTKEDCRKIKRPSNILNSNKTFDLYPYFTFDQKCVYECPEGHEFKGMDNDDKNTSDNYETEACQVTENDFAIVNCKGNTITEISDLISFRGCTNIKGSVTISIENNIEEEILEENLLHIKEIDGYLAIIGVTSLKTLHVFKSLQKINGNELYKNKYAIFIFYNENLETLFKIPYSIEVRRGGIFFSMNPSLCISRVRRLQQLITEISGSCCDATVIGNDDNC